MDKHVIERKLIKLSDGSYEKIFSKEAKSGENKESASLSLYNCHLCRVGRLPGLDKLQVHIQGKKHLKNLEKVPDAKSYRKPLEASENCQLSVSAKENSEENSSKSAVSMAHQASYSSRLSSFDLNKKANEVGLKAYHMQKYKQDVEYSIKRLEKDYERYRRTPEDHPMYKDEWIEFWGRRYKELKKEGRVNANDYDYKPEWIKFWTERMKEIFEESIEAKKKEIRAKFGLPMNFEVNKSKPERKRQRSSSQSSIEYDVISSEDEYPPYRRRRSSSNSSHPSSNYYDTRPTYKATTVPYRPLYDEYINEPVTFINVCRLLSALESELGSLSNKVLDLLSKALAIEKVKPNTCDEALMTTENAIFLETVKEKMKGLLMVEVLPRNKVAAVKKCIQNIAKLIHQTPINKEEEKVEIAPQLSREDDERMKLAKEITEMLKAHGKEDWSTEELEVLVDTYLENSNEQSKTVTEKRAQENRHSSLESLNDDDLKILLGNFVDLDADEQNHLIEFLTHIEKTNPSRVAELRKYVKIDKPSFDKNEVIEIDNDPDDYNIEEVISSVVGQSRDVVSPTQIQPPGTSLTDNLLSLNNNRSFN